MKKRSTAAQKFEIKFLIRVSDLDIIFDHKNFANLLAETSAKMRSHLTPAHLCFQICNHRQGYGTTLKICRNSSKLFTIFYEVFLTTHCTCTNTKKKGL